MSQTKKVMYLLVKHDLNTFHITEHKTSAVIYVYYVQQIKSYPYLGWCEWDRICLAALLCSRAKYLKINKIKNRNNSYRKYLT